jgi:hypothetical protein
MYLQGSQTNSVCVCASVCCTDSLLTTFTGGKSKIEGPAFAMICRFYKIISPSKALRIERMHIICITLLHTIEALRMTEISCADAHSIRKQKFSPLERS